MLITAISDLHGVYPELESGDLLIVCGDLTKQDKPEQFRDFFTWLKRQPFSYKVVIAGNHDGWLEKNGWPKEWNVRGIHYLQDSEVEIEGLKIWGCPWTPIFFNVNPLCSAFMLKEEDLEEKYNKIPEDLDILVTHGPMYSVLDRNRWKECCGSVTLRSRVLVVSQPSYHFFGHIHEQGGKKEINGGFGKNVVCVNCSYLNEMYKPVNKIMKVEYGADKHRNKLEEYRSNL